MGTRMSAMKQHNQSNTEITVAWNPDGVDGGVLPIGDELRELASALGRIAARRELTRLRENSAGSCPSSDDKFAKMPKKAPA